MLKFKRCCQIILYSTALRKHPNVRIQVGQYRLSPGPWPRKQKNPDNLKELTPPQLSLPACFAADCCNFSQQQAAPSSRSEHSLQPVQGHRTRWMKTNIFFRERTISFLRCVMCFSILTVGYFSTKSLQSLQAYSPELIDRSLRLLCFNDSKWLECTRTLYQWIHILKHAIQQKYCHFYISSQLLWNLNWGLRMEIVEDTVLTKKRV